MIEKQMFCSSNGLNNFDTEKGCLIYELKCKFEKHRDSLGYKITNSNTMWECLENNYDFILEILTELKKINKGGKND